MVIPLPSRRVRQAAVVLAAALAVLVSLALGTPARADHVPVHGTILGRGGFATPTDIKLKSVLGGRLTVSNAPDAADVIVQQITIQPGGFTGWHTHPGPAVVVITAGTLTYYPGDDAACTGYDFTAGQAFTDPGQGHVHSAWNEGSTPVSLYVTYFDVPPGAGPAIPVANPGNCGF
jgi:quercetin dioxygenase-like cupin family protein